MPRIGSAIVVEETDVMIGGHAMSVVCHAGQANCLTRRGSRSIAKENAIAAPLAKVGDTVQSAFDKLKGGDPSGINNANSTIASTEGTSKGNGVAIQEDDNANLASKPN